ncbi:MAG: LOG family protein, partial [Gammaproteobacteria bacterium]
LAEVLTLIQTGKSRRVPIVLVEGAFWNGLLDWMKQKMVGGGLIGPEDLKLLQVVEGAEQVLPAILQHYGERHYESTPEEDDLMFEL